MEPVDCPPESQRKDDGQAKIGGSLPFDGTDTLSAGRATDTHFGWETGILLPRLALDVRLKFADTFS